MRRWMELAIQNGRDTPMMSPGRGRGFTLLELMITMTIILVLATLALPSYRTSILRAREAVLRDNLFTLRSLIDQFTLDKKMAPQSLEDLVEEGYLRKIPEDPFTASNLTWVEDFGEDIFLSADQELGGIVDVHSGSAETSIEGSLYSSW